MQRKGQRLRRAQKCGRDGSNDTIPLALRRTLSVESSLIKSSHGCSAASKPPGGLFGKFGIGRKTMQKLHFSVVVNAPKEKVWHAMLDDESYREWTKAFNEGGYYQGSWEKGSKILFLGPDPETGKEGGMVSRIADNRP